MLLEKLTENYLILLSNFNIRYKRYFLKKIDFREKLIGIVGARGVGKTTALLQYIKDNNLPLEKNFIFQQILLRYLILLYLILQKNLVKKVEKFL